MELNDKICRLCLEEKCVEGNCFYNLSSNDGNNRSSKALCEIFRIDVRSFLILFLSAMK